MSYSEELRPASYDGVPFEAFTTGEGGGRRGTVNEYSNSDDAKFNDKGKKTKPFTLSASVFGEDALTQAQNLSNALNKPGPLRLVHPTLGEMQATCLNFDRKSSSDTALRVNFMLEFFQEPQKSSGVKISQNPNKAAEKKQSDNKKQSSDNFKKEFKNKGQQDFISKEAKKELTKMTDIMADFLGDTQTLIDQYNLILDSIIDDPEKLIQETQELMGTTIRAASFSNQSFNTTSLEQALLGFDIGFDTESNTQQNGSSAPTLQQTLIAGASNAFNNARTLQQFTTDYQQIALITTTRQTQQNNAKAIEIAVRETASIIESELHLGDEGATLFTSRELAQFNLKILLKQMQARKNESPDSAATLSELMAATATASSAKYGIIADQKTISIDTDTNSLVVSYELYNNFNREAEIRSRNKLTDTFIKKGTILKVSEQ